MARLASRFAQNVAAEQLLHIRSGPNPIDTVASEADLSITEFDASSLRHGYGFHNGCE